MKTTFTSLGLPDQLVSSLADRQINEPFPIQAATIPDALAGRDVSGRAPTGSGKTLAFGLPVLAKVEQGRKRKPRSLILAPTRELAEQIKEELAPLARKVDRYVFAIYGGVGYGGQRTALNRGVDVLVATPGRLEDLIEQGLADLSDVDLVVVDEADRMADMGFLPAVRRILNQTSSDRQTLLFSATLDGDVAVLIRDYQADPVRHEAGTVEPETIDAQHHFWLVDHHDRVQHTADLVSRSDRSIVFTRTRRGADRLAKQLGKSGVHAVAMHGGRSQNQRQRALKDFSKGRVRALVATDVAARGIHIDDVETVIHYDPAGDHKDYLHRSGRTGRAGATGTVVSLVTGQQKRDVRRMLQKLDMDASFGQPDPASVGEGGYVPGGSPIESSETWKRNGSSKRTKGGHTAKREVERPASNGSQSLFVGNLPWGATDEDIREVFAQHGKVEDATIIRKNGKSKGFGFVEMAHSDASDAVEALHGSQLGGRDLKVRVARPRSRKR